MLVAQLAVHADSSSSAPAPATAAPSPAPAPAPAAAVPSAPELQAQLDAAIRSHAATFTIPPGAYNFSTSNLNITGASALRLVATGVTAWFGGTAGVNISNSNSLHISGLSVNYTNPPHGRLGVPGITYNLLNCSDVISEDITIYKAPFFSVTAFNGGGGHTFRRFHLPNDTATNAKGRPSDPYPHQRDAFHFTDLRRGVVVEDSHASGFGDDFFNSHNTIMLVLKRESPTTLLIINPHLQNVKKGENGIISNKNTVYGTNCVLENLRAGDSVHFFGCPACLSSNGPGKNTNCTEEDFLIPPLGSDDSFIAGNPEEVTDAAVLADAAALAHNLTKFTNFDASDVWRVKFTAALPDSVGRAALVNIDAFSTPGTVIQNNNFSYTKYNLGRFKSTFSSSTTSPNQVATVLGLFYDMSSPEQVAVG